VTPRHGTTLRDLGPRHGRAHRAGWFWRSVGLTTTAVLAFGASASSYFAYTAMSNMNQIRPNSYVDAGDRPPVDPAAGNSLNILLIGSDDRSGENGVIGGVDPTLDNTMRSDTTIVMHISSDRKRVEMVSIPRDSLVKIPSCTTTRGKTKAENDAMFNKAFANGWDRGGDIDSAVACTIVAVEANTGLRIDHSVVVDFAGFQRMVDAVHGVNLCLEHPMKDSKYTGLDLPAGPQHLNGVQALQFARARHVTGSDGSDTSRIDRQQQLMGALAQEVLSKNVLKDGRGLAKFVDAATESLSLDITPRTIIGLAYSMRNIDTSKIVFTTIPFVNEGNRVRWTSQADVVWKAMAKDQSVADALNPPAPTPKPGEKVQPTPAPTQVVTVDQMQADSQVCAS